MGCDIHIFLERKNSENQWVDSMIYENDPYDGFISHLKNIIKVQDCWVDDKEIDDNAEKYRVCFFFDN